MQTATSIAAARQWTREQRRVGRRVGFVPTMGFLHAGHMALVARARAECDAVAASIFVNPLQFGPQEDFGRYPRAFARDRAMLAAAGVDLLFAPDVTEMYPEPVLTLVEPTLLSDHLCGASRPGHFRGVATVVSKLLHIIDPDAAYFGEKDAQQLAIIRRLVQDLNFAVAIVGVPTVREADGLALSSRNAYLDAPERQAALVLSRALARARELVAAGEHSAARLLAELTGLVAAEPLARIDYISIVDPVTLQPIHRLTGPALLALAVFIGRTRLIDNTLLEVAPVASDLLSR